MIILVAPTEINTYASILKYSYKEDYLIVIISSSHPCVRHENLFPAILILIVIELIVAKKYKVKMRYSGVVE